MSTVTRDSRQTRPLPVKFLLLGGGRFREEGEGGELGRGGGPFWFPSMICLLLATRGGEAWISMAEDAKSTTETEP